MTTLYRPVLIESAEQAEALAAGTLARHAAGSSMDHAHKLGPLPGHDNSFMWISLSGPVASPAMVGWTALVPIVAREESMGAAYWPGPFGKRTQRILARLVTPWEAS